MNAPLSPAELEALKKQRYIGASVPRPNGRRLVEGAAVYVDSDWRVTRLEEKPPRGTATTRWNNAGVLALSASIFDFARRLRPSPRGEYELPTAIAAMVAEGRTVRALPIRGFWSDVGTRDDLEEARRRFVPHPVSS